MARERQYPWPMGREVVLREWKETAKFETDAVKNAEPPSGCEEITNLSARA